MTLLMERPKTKIINTKEEYKRYDIWMAEMRDGIGVEQVGTRPVVIIQNDKGNMFSPAVIIAPLTSSCGKARLPTHVYLDGKTHNLKENSTILLEQIVTIDKKRLKYKISTLNESDKKNMNNALSISVGLTSA